MATTWKVITAEIKGTMKYVTFQEVVDDIPGKKYAIKMHKTAPNFEMRKKLKAKISIDRQLAPENIAFKAAVETAAT